jgi:hypothetical protein
MGESLLFRAAWAIGALLLCWSVAFFAGRVMHRRDSVLQSPETVPWQGDALGAIPLACLFATRDVGGPSSDAIRPTASPSPWRQASSSRSGWCCGRCEAAGNPPASGRFLGSGERAGARVARAATSGRQRERVSSMRNA